LVWPENRIFQPLIVTETAVCDGLDFVTFSAYLPDYNPIRWYQLQVQDALSADSSTHDELTVAIDTIPDCDSL
jgi:hypothetical protein